MRWGDFLEESRAYAVKADAVILQTVRAAGAEGVTLLDVCMQAKSGLGDWPQEKDTETRSMACGHLQRLVDWGLVLREMGKPVRFLRRSGRVGMREVAILYLYLHRYRYRYLWVVGGRR